MDENKSYRIRTEVGKDSVINVNLNQSYKNFELLSLKIGTDNLYKFHTSKYGCVAGRVLANGNFGIPNAKISIFIAASDEDLSDEILAYLYPYKSVRDTNVDKIRYNLLPEEQLSDCHRNVGTFPSKRMVLDDDNVLEIYDRFYKFTTRSNEAGDYMIFGVPVGNQTLHVDIDLSDIGILSQRPRDMVYKGYNITQFENANMFKKSTELDSLTQIISENSNVYVYPFWGEESEGDIAITRKDIEIQYTFEPTCVFMGSIVTDEKSNAISKRCIPSERMGKMDRLTTGEGTIEMIRKKADGTTEEMVIQGNQLINGEGVWCYQIPMNLDYVRTDEYGNIVPTDDPTKGVPTRTRVRFRISLNEPENVGYTHLTKVLVPNNPKKYEDLDYTFGSSTIDNEEASLSFRDLFWNDVYTVKSFIPRIQQFNFNRNKKFSGFKAVNIGEKNNPIPYNNMRVDISFIFVLQCAIFKALLKIVQLYNVFARKFTGTADDIKYDFKLPFNIKLRIEFLRTLSNFFKNSMNCITISGALCPDLNGWYFAPGCLPGKEYAYNSTWKLLKNKESDVSDEESVESKNGDDDERVCLTSNINYFVQCVEINLAMEHEVIQFDFYNDWVNGMIYSPRWYAQLKKKRTYFFGLIRLRQKINACMEDNFKNSRRYTEQCSLGYSVDENGAYTNKTTKKGCVSGRDRQRCHKSPGRNWIKILKATKGGGGLVHGENISNNKVAYYLRPCEWLNRNNSFETKCNLFATDIVLLGNLEENNEQGIPQSFTKLQSSSYQIPDTLATTNMGIEGYLYTYDGTSRCNKSLGEEGISSATTTFTSLKKWASDQGTSGNDNGSDLNDEDEYAVTEASGIDWGYSGPNQGKNSIDKMYFPGGHFLGISCINSEVNVKSCINLRRICELGSIISQRQAIIDKTRDNDYSVGYMMPTGFISKDEIIDDGFRNEFATMNHNGLKTRYSKENHLKEYDFVNINPVNFNGDLKEVYNEGEDRYQRLEGFKDSNDDSVSTTTSAYTRTIEDTSLDYYRYRMGIVSDNIQEESKTKFLLFKNGSAFLPVYNNSFYFYFGLFDGATALDKFKNNFFAECPSLKQYTPDVKIEVFDSDLCEDNGSIKITIKNVDNANIFVNGEPSGTNITGLPHNGTYEVMVYGDNIETVEKEVTIGTITPFYLTNIEVNVDDFLKEVYYTPTNFSSKWAAENGGYFSITFINVNNFSYIRLENSVGYHYVYGTSSVNPNDKEEINYGTIPGDINQCYVWQGNSDYTLIFGIDCDGEIREYSYTPFTVSMPSDLNIIFNNNSDCNWNYIKNNVDSIGPNGTDVLKAINSSQLSTSIKDSLKQALYYKKTCCEFSDNGSIIFSPVYGTPPYTFNITQPYQEYITTTTVVYNEGEEDEYSDEIPLISVVKNTSNVNNIDILNNFYVPTVNGTYSNMSSQFNMLSGIYPPSYFDVYYTNKSFAKFLPPLNGYQYTTMHNWKHELTIMDGDNSSLSLDICSIYLPFYFYAVVYSEWNWVKPEITVSIVNGIRDDNGKMKSVVFNGEVLTNEQFQNGQLEKYEYDEVLSGTTNPLYTMAMCSKNMEKTFTTIAVSGETEYSNTYTLSVEDKFDKISKTVTVTFIGDEKNGIIMPYDTRVKYYAIKNYNKFKETKAYYECPTYSLEGSETITIQYEIKYRMGYIWNGDTTGYWLPEVLENSERFYSDPEIKGGDLFGNPTYEGHPIYDSEHYILGVYDENIDNDITRHTNNIAILKVYRGDIFSNFINRIISVYGNPYSSTD